MSDILAETADAVAAALNAAVAAGTFTGTPQFTAVRAHLPDKDVEDYVNLTVIVALRAWTEELVSRRDSRWTVQVDVGTIKNVGAERSNEILDPLQRLVLEMGAKEVLGKLLTTAGGPAEFVSRESQPHFDRDKLKNKNTWFNITTYTYLCQRRR